MSVKVFLCVVGFSLVYSILPPLTYAKTLIYEEDFSDEQALENWEVVRNEQWRDPHQTCLDQGEAAHWEINDGEAGIVIDGPSCITEIVPKDFHYSLKNNFIYEFDWHLKESIHMDRNVIFEWHDANNWYDFKLLGHSILLQKVVDGQVYNLEGQSSNYVFQEDTTYHFEITYIDGVITLYIDGEKVLEALDEEPQIAGNTTFGLQASSGRITRSVSFFDNLKVYTLEELHPSLPVETIKQTDQRWAHDEYDSAAEWSEVDATIASWGCALTALSTVFRYHNIRHMPDGSELTPATLNAWLINEPDGYIGSGLLNWAAAMRLSKQISDVYGTHKIEYKRLPYTQTAVATQIDSSHPPIIHLPGHFVVGRGYDEHETYISDPFYPHERLSEHEEEPLNIRSLTPSNTDLSYIVVAHSPEISVVLEEAEAHMEYLTHPTASSHQHSPTTSLLEISQPQETEYTITARADAELTTSNGTEKLHTIEIFAYDLDGTVTDLTQTNISLYRERSWNLTFSRDSASSIHEKITVADLQNDLTHLHSQELLPTLVYYRLRQLLTYVSEHQDFFENYKQVLQREFHWYKQFMSQTVSTDLEQSINSLTT